MAKPCAPWTAEQLDFLQRHYADHKTAWIAEQIGHPMRGVYQKAKAIGLRKSHSFLATEASGRLQRADHRGRTTQFKPGTIPWNKGKPFESGGRSAETRFKTGQKPHTWNPIGHERVSRDGYLQRKMTDTGITRRDYVYLHRLVWLDAGRDIPPGHAICFKDGDKRNFALDNLELVSRADLMRRNTRHNLPKEINDLIQLRCAISRRISSLEKDAA